MLEIASFASSKCVPLQSRSPIYDNNYVDFHIFLSLDVLLQYLNVNKHSPIHLLNPSPCTGLPIKPSTEHWGGKDRNWTCSVVRKGKERSAFSRGKNWMTCFYFGKNCMTCFCILRQLFKNWMTCFCILRQLFKNWITCFCILRQLWLSLLAINWNPQSKTNPRAGWRLGGRDCQR